MRKISTAIFAVLLFALFSAHFASAKPASDLDNAETLFAAGNEYYEQGAYVLAIDEYNKILETGYESANVYYNLGNAYFKSGDSAQAVISYERAKRLNPGDSDLTSNYKFVRANIATPLLTPRGIWNWRLLKEYRDGFTVDSLFLVSSGLYIVAMIFLIAGIYLRRFTRRFMVIVVLLLVCASGNLFVAFHASGEIGTKAIVIKQESESYYGPFDSATVFFKLHKGIEVVVLQRRMIGAKYGVQMGNADGLKGLISKSYKQGR